MLISADKSIQFGVRVKLIAHIFHFIKRNIFGHYYFQKIAKNENGNLTSINFHSPRL